MLDTHCLNLGQIAHKLWILSLFFLFTTFGDERVAEKLKQIILMYSAGAKTYI